MVGGCYVLRMHCPCVRRCRIVAPDQRHNASYGKDHNDKELKILWKCRFSFYRSLIVHASQIRQLCHPDRQYASDDLVCTQHKLHIIFRRPKMPCQRCNSSRTLVLCNARNVSVSSDRTPIQHKCVEGREFLSNPRKQCLVPGQRSQVALHV